MYLKLVHVPVSYLVFNGCVVDFHMIFNDLDEISKVHIKQHSEFRGS